MSVKSSPRSPTSPHRRHRVDEKKQERLDEETAEYVERIGSLNHFQAQYHAEVAEAALTSDKAVLQELKPHIFDLKRESWRKAFCFALAVLKRYKMKFTVQAVKAEYPSLPKNTGFQHGSEVDEYFETLLDVSKFLGQREFEDQVEALIREMERKNQQDEDEGRSKSSKHSRKSRNSKASSSANPTKTSQFRFDSP